MHAICGLQLPDSTAKPTDPSPREKVVIYRLARPINVHFTPFPAHHISLNRRNTRVTDPRIPPTHRNMGKPTFLTSLGQNPANCQIGRFSTNGDQKKDRKRSYAEQVRLKNSVFEKKIVNSQILSIVSSSACTESWIRGS